MSSAIEVSSGDTLHGTASPSPSGVQAVERPLQEAQSEQSVVLGTLHAIDFSWTCRTQCEVRITRERGNLYSVFVPRLPGVASQGRSRDEALLNIREALECACEVYRSERGAVPWLEEIDPPDADEEEAWVIC